MWGFGEMSKNKGLKILGKKLGLSKKELMLYLRAKKMGRKMDQDYKAVVDKGEN